ncbi:DsbA family protein [Microbacterium sp. NPDC057407]|uniref:DsbA family protein n=1 Tax=Microbacterium sp. NPDC057407 TaxID=3346120 RepID=UPI00366F1772
MKTPVKATLVSIAVVVMLLLAALIYVLVNQSQTAPPSSGGGDASPQVVRGSSHVLDDGGEGAVTVVEFLDFECEACGAFYPIVEDLRKQFDGEITYVVRYFPLPGHANSENAAIAAEAAAQQGRFEDLYHRLFETQAEWGEAQESRADLFRGFAEELGLDMAAYDEAVADPATAMRVDMDFEEGRSLGVSSTPTFFVDGKLAELQEWDDLENVIQAAVNGGQ